MAVEGELPLPIYRIMAKDVKGIVITHEFEIPMIRCKPSIQYLPDLYASVSHPETVRGFFSSIPGITVNPDVHSIHPCISGVGQDIPKGVSLLDNSKVLTFLHFL